MLRSSNLQCTCFNKISRIKTTTTINNKINQNKQFSTSISLSNSLAERLSNRLASKSPPPSSSSSSTGTGSNTIIKNDSIKPYKPSIPLKSSSSSSSSTTTTTTPRSNTYSPTPLGRLVNTAIKALTSSSPSSSSSFGYNEYKKPKGNIFLDQQRERRLNESNSTGGGVGRGGGRGGVDTSYLSTIRLEKLRGAIYDKREKDLKELEEKATYKLVSEKSTKEESKIQPFKNRLPGQSSRGSNTRLKLKKRNRILLGLGTGAGESGELSSQEEFNVQNKIDGDIARRSNGRFLTTELMPSWEELNMTAKRNLVEIVKRSREVLEKEKLKAKRLRDLIKTKAIIEMKDVVGFQNALEEASKSKFKWQIEQERELALADSKLVKQNLLAKTENPPVTPESTQEETDPTSLIFDSLLSTLNAPIPLKPSSQIFKPPTIKLSSIELSYPVGIYTKPPLNHGQLIKLAEEVYENRRVIHNSRRQAIINKELREAKQKQISGEMNQKAAELESTRLAAIRNPQRVIVTPPSISNFLYRVASGEAGSVVEEDVSKEKEKVKVRTGPKNPGPAQRKEAQQIAAAISASTTPPTPTILKPLPPKSSYASFITPSSALPIPVLPPFPPVPIAKLSHGLERVLFNPGVHFLQDPRSGVYNFSRTLQNVPPLKEFNFSLLPGYITSSKDETLLGIGKREGMEFVGSTSSTVGMLCQIYFFLSKGKEPNANMLTNSFSNKDLRGFSFGQTVPVSIIMHENQGIYSIDADKSFEPPAENILASYGHLMEKFLTSDEETFKRFLIDSDDPAPSEVDNRQAYHYVKTNNMILRSQLDAHNEFLPKVSFDVKTRGTAAIRMDRYNHLEGSEYHIEKLQGEWESFEKEYFDLIRSAFLKYQFQARIGNMDGCIVAYHNTTRFFGFQYIPIEEMDIALFGSTAEGDAVFPVCLALLEKVLLSAKESYPGQSLNVTIDAFPADLKTGQDTTLLRIFVQPKDGPNNLMTLIEFEGTSYVGDVAVEQLVTDKHSQGRKFPDWEFGYRITRHIADGKSDTSTLITDTSVTGTNSPSRTPLTSAQIFSLFAAARKEQLSFNTAVLPPGISPYKLSAAAARNSRRASIISTLNKQDSTQVEELETISSSSSSDEISAPTSEELLAAADEILVAKFPTVKGLTYIGNPTNLQSSLRNMARKSKAARQALPAKDGKIAILKSTMEIIDNDEIMEEAQKLEPVE